MSIPASEAAKRVALLFGRKVLFHWSEKEERVFKKLLKEGCFDDLDDLGLIEQYYAFERAKKGDKGIHRRDLYTFLNNYHGELDRARAWAEKNPHKAVRHVTQKEDPKRWREFCEAVYPEARVTSFWSTPESVQKEFREWEKKQ